MGKSDQAGIWWHADTKSAPAEVLSTVRRIEQNQSEVFQRMRNLERLYDPYTPMVGADDDEKHGGVHENAIATNVDTISAIIATTDVRVRVMTDGADWEQQRRARKLEMYAEEQNITHKVLHKCRAAFKECAKKGNGLIKVRERFGAPHVEQVMVENVVVPDDEARDNRDPWQMHEWVTVDADELIAEFPKYRTQILNARMNRPGWRIEGRYFPTTGNQVTYLDSYRLGIGIPGKRGYIAGRHLKTLTDVALLDEEWEKAYPYAIQIWTARAKSWYGISGAERIAGIQRALNRRNWHIEKQNDQISLPTTFVRPADANLATRTSKIGQVAVCKGDYPQTVMPNAVSPETYQDRERLRGSAREEFGLSPMATHGTKPAGVDSAVALREFKDQSSDRYSPQEKDFEQLVLDTTWLILDVCKDLGKDAPVAIRQSRFGARKIKWPDVDMGEVRVQLQAASNLPRTSTGRMQLTIELAQAGVISRESSQRLLKYPDLESEWSLYTAALESVEQSFDEIAEGRTVMPEPFMNLAMIGWRGDAEYLKWRGDGAPEDRLELLRQFVVTAVWMKNGGAAATANANATAAGAQPAMAGAMPGAQPGAMPGAPPGPMPPGMPPGALPPGGMPQGPPQGPPPMSAFAPSAMHLVAGTG